MQDTTDYDETAVAEALTQAKPLITGATEVGREILAEHGDPLYADSYADATITAMSEKYVSPMINRIKWASGGPHEVPAHISAGAHLIHDGAKLNRTIGTIRMYREELEEGALSAERTLWYQEAVRTLYASLAAVRAALAERQPATTPTLDMDATYTVTYPGDTEPTTITPTVRTKTRPDGVTLTIIKGLTPLLAERVDAIADESNRMHTLIVLGGAMICIRDTPEDDAPEDESESMAGSYWRDRGTLATTYYGTRDLPVSAVLDLAEQLRIHLADDLGEPKRDPQQVAIDGERDARITASQDELDNEAPTETWVWLIADFRPFPGAPDATVTDDPDTDQTRDGTLRAVLQVLPTSQSAADPASPASAAIRSWQEDPSLNHVWIHDWCAMAIFPYGGNHGSLEEASQSTVRQLGQEYAPRYAKAALVVEGEPLTPEQENWRRSVEANDAQQ